MYKKYSTDKITSPILSISNNMRKSKLSEKLLTFLIVNNRVLLLRILVAFITDTSSVPDVVMADADVTENRLRP